ncbi:MAG: FHA domain-containing protein [Nannocystis sp.]|nr:FHA domain-containing protein [Nannocystis sp.]
MQITVVDHKTRRTVCERLFDVFPVRIGRDNGNDVVLPFPFVSAWHAEVRSDGEALRLCDLGATNGLFIGPRRIAGGGAVPLHDRLVVTVGELELRLEIPRPDAPAEPTESDDLPRLPGGAAPRGAAATSGSIGEALPSFATDDTDFAARLARLQTSLHELRPHHAQLEAARRAWDENLARSVRTLEASGDRQGVNMLLREFPARDRGGLVMVGAADPYAAADEERGAIVQAASELLPGLRAPTGEDESRRFLTRIIDVLRVFAACTLELQHVRALQAEELGVTWADPNDPLAALATRGRGPALPARLARHRREAQRGARARLRRPRRPPALIHPLRPRGRPKRPQLAVPGGGRTRRRHRLAQPRRRPLAPLHHRLRCAAQRDPRPPYAGVPRDPPARLHPGFGPRRHRPPQGHMTHPRPLLAISFMRPSRSPAAASAPCPCAPRPSSAASAPSRPTPASCRQRSGSACWSAASTARPCSRPTIPTNAATDPSPSRGPTSAAPPSTHAAPPSRYRRAH